MAKKGTGKPGGAVTTLDAPIKSTASQGDNGPRLEIWSIDRIKPYENNPRTLPEKAVAKVAGSLKKFGFQKPIVIDEQGIILAGHVVLKAAQQAGFSRVPVLISNLDAKAARAYRLADNRTAQETDWLDALLKDELTALDDDGFDMASLGFDDRELQKLLSSDEELERAEETPEAPVNPVTIEGDVWILGNHRIICGDSTKAEVVDKLTRGAMADFCFTSPPYGQQRKYGFKDGIEDWDALMNGVFSLLPTKAGAQVLVNLGLIHKDNEWQPYWNAWIDWMRAAGWRSFGWYVWDQGHGLPGDWQGRPAPSHEFIFHFNREPAKLNKTVAKKEASIQFNDHGTGLRGADGKMSGVSNRSASLQTHKIPDSVFRVMRHKARSATVKHPAMFPVALVIEVSDAYTKMGDTLYEPFSGSGTTIIAGEMTGRHVYAIELNPAYVDVAVKRWQDYTGQKATHAETGQTFDEVCLARYENGERLKDAADSYEVGIAAMRAKLNEGNDGEGKAGAEAAPTA